MPRRSSAAMPAWGKPTVATGPQAGWPRCDLASLPGLLDQGGWSLVEFWAPDILFSRVLAPARARMARTHATRVRLLCCVTDGPGPDCAAFGAAALPALVLFAGAARKRRWLGAIDAFLLAHEVDQAMADAAP